MLNATLLNGMGVVGEIVGTPRWRPASNGERVQLTFSHSRVLWPWSGWLAVRVTVDDERAARDSANGWSGAGIAEGVIEVTVSSPPPAGEAKRRSQVLTLPLRVEIVQPPARERRVLWDQFHNVRYPSGYVCLLYTSPSPRDRG